MDYKEQLHLIDFAKDLAVEKDLMNIAQLLTENAAAITELLERAEDAEKRCEIKDLLIKAYQDELTPQYSARIKRLEQELDAAREIIAKDIGVTDAGPIKTCFGYPFWRVRELVEADRAGQCFITPFVAMVEQSLMNGEMKPNKDQRFNGRYAVVYCKPQRWATPLIDVCGTPYHINEAEKRVQQLNKEAAEMEEEAQ